MLNTSIEVVPEVRELRRDEPSEENEYDYSVDLWDLPDLPDVKGSPLQVFEKSFHLSYPFPVDVPVELQS